MEKMSKQKFIRLVMAAAGEVVKTSIDKSITIEAEVPSGTKTDQVSIVVRGRRGISKPCMTTRFSPSGNAAR